MPAKPPQPDDERWRPSDRALRYWSAIMVVVLGVLCGALIPGTLGGTICTVIVGLGLIAVVSMAFYDVGLTEDRERAQMEERLDRLERREAEQARQNPRSAPDPHAGAEAGRRHELGRMRGERRRLR